ncbi:MAG: hypothetical protein U0228_08725 [Myxococcaceae bacterium]
MPAPVEVVSHEGLRLERFAGGAVVIRIDERPKTSWYEVGEPVCDRAVTEAPGRAVIAVDVHSITDFEPGFRDRWAKWFAKNRHGVARVVVWYNGSILIKLGITAVNIAFGGRIEAATTRAGFDEAVKRVTG